MWTLEGDVWAQVMAMPLDLLAPQISHLQNRNNSSHRVAIRKMELTYAHRALQW